MKSKIQIFLYLPVVFAAGLFLTCNPGLHESLFNYTGIDVTKPVVVSASIVNSTTMEIVFSESVDVTSSENTGNYTITGSDATIETINSATRQLDKSRLRLSIAGSFSQPFYMVTASTAIADLRGNVLKDSPYNQASFIGEGSMPEYFSDGPVIEDPLSDGTSTFAMLMVYKNRVYIGPANSDNGFFSINADGTDAERVTFIFNGNPGTTTTLNPGPDSENGIDYFASGTIGGTECLFIGPSKTAGNLDYIYYTTDSGKILNFSYINLAPVLGPQTKGVSSMHTFNNRFYMSFPDTGGSRPYFIKLKNVMQNPAAGTDVFNLQAKNMPVIGKISNTASIIGLESMIDYNDNIYIADGGNNVINENGGIYQSSNNDPGDYDLNAGHWLDATPSSDTEWNKSATRFSLELLSNNKLNPSDKAFPAMAVFNGALYIIRNTIGTAGGPQLWKYDGADWSLVASNGTGITDMSNSDNQYITLLIVNGDRLYVGYNNDENGVQILRTKDGVTDPASESDFESVTSDGLGDSTSNREIFHSLSITSASVDYLWILCGIDGGNLRVYRTKN